MQKMCRPAVGRLELLLMAMKALMTNGGSSSCCFMTACLSPQAAYCTCTLLPALEHLPGGTYATANRTAALPVDGLVGTTSFSRAPRRGPRTAHRRASGRSAHASPRPSYFGWFTLEGNGRNEKKVFGRPRKNNHARRTSCPRRARGERGPRNAAAERFVSRERSRDGHRGL